ncbi:unnamed protein product [Candidula unifasciata]|uniref:G-protein coupled receptors family 1 profile domain-containing protein n=1 Tax=Candidula unifasciata TaxID=100452 RepID=A0A8S3ZL03_9EUPU|nr:unnamed protein product [Candidula unifasciata]
MMGIGNITKHVTIVISLVSNAQYISVMESCAIVWTILSVLGIISNIINIRTFVAMGLTDGITVSFLALAIFDLSYLVCSLSLGISVAFSVFEQKSLTRFMIDPYGISIFSGSVMILINETNVLTTTFLAVARCMCVAKPLQFKNTFTRKRAIMFMVGFAVFAIVTYSPILANMGMRHKFETLLNRTRPALWVSPVRESVKEIIWTINNMLLPFATQFIIIICVFIMSRSLRAASRFRQSSVAMTEKGFEKHGTNHNTNLNEVDLEFSEANNSVDKLTGKDLRVIQQVVLISVVYIVCNTPKILISIVTTLEPEFTIGKGYTRLYLCVNGMRMHFEIVNSAVNLIIYYKFNTKFRTVLGF